MNLTTGRHLFRTTFRSKTVDEVESDVSETRFRERVSADAGHVSVAARFVARFETVRFMFRVSGKLRC